MDDGEGEEDGDTGQHAPRTKTLTAVVTAKATRKVNKAAVPPNTEAAIMIKEVPESSNQGAQKVRANPFVIDVILKVILYKNTLWFSVVTSVVVTMLLRLAQT